MNEQETSHIYTRLQPEISNGQSGIRSKSSPPVAGTDDAPPAYTALFPPPNPTPGSSQAGFPGTVQFPTPSGQPVASYPQQAVYHTPGPLPWQPGQQQQQQPQQQVVLVSAVQPQQPVTFQRTRSFACHMVFACIVFWLCNWLFGLVAFVLAVAASDTAVSNPSQARKYGFASIALSVSGTVISVIIVVVVVVVSVASSDWSFAASQQHCPYRHRGVCYNYMTPIDGRDSCDGGVRSYDVCYSQCLHFAYDGTCYRYRTYVGSSNHCPDGGVTSSSGYCYANRCNSYEVDHSCYKYVVNVGNNGTCSHPWVRYGDYCYSSFCPHYTYLGDCYEFRTYVGYGGNCSEGVKSLKNYCFSNSCSHGYAAGGSCYPW